MIKKFIILSIVFLSSSISFSQEISKGSVEITPNIGYTSSSILGENSPQTDPRKSYQVGIVGDYYFNGRWSLRSGVSKYNMGVSASGSDLNLDYLNISLNVNWHFGKTRKWNLNFGGTPGFLLTADIDGRNVQNDYKPFNIALSFGIGYKIKITDNIRILLDFQSLTGLTPILEASSPLWLNMASGYNVGWVFSF